MSDSRRRRSGIRPMVMVACLTGWLVLTACGDDDGLAHTDDGPKCTPADLTEYDSTDDTKAPAWATDPCQVLKLDKSANGDESTIAAELEGDWMTQDDCVYRKGVFATAEVSEDGQFSEVSYVDTDDDPIKASLDAMRDDASGGSVLASPVYLVSPMPAHMMFPGSLAVPVSEDSSAATVTEPTPAATDKAKSVPVAVVDTRFIPESQANTIIDSPYTYGHANFVGSVVAGHTNNPEMIAFVNVEDSSPDQAIPRSAKNPLLAGESQFAEALKIGVDRDSGVNRTVNLSLGVYPCSVTEEGETNVRGGQALPLVPVATLKAISDLAGSPAAGKGQLALVMAAGNSPAVSETFPAAFAEPSVLLADDRMQRWLELAGVDPDVLAKTLEPLKSSLIAVAATPAGVIPDVPAGIDVDPSPSNPPVPQQVEYSTTGAWVTTTTQGCHVAAYPGGTFAYPTGPDGESARKVMLGKSAYWCGTSFAAPVVTAYAAQRLAAGDLLETIKANLRQMGSSNGSPGELDASLWEQWGSEPSP